MADPTPPTPVAITTDTVRRRLGDMAAYVALLGEADAAAVYSECALAAERNFERKLGLRLAQTKIVSGDRPDLTRGEDYDVLEDALDYRRGDLSTDKLPVWTTISRPIISVQEIRLEFATTTAQVLLIPPAWIRVYHQLGKVAVVPVGPGVAIAASTGLWYAGLLDRAWTWPVIPQLVKIDYTAGWADPATDPELDELRIAASFAAAIDVVESVRHMIPDSVNMSGFNSSSTPVEQILERWNKRVDKFMSSWIRQHRPPRLVVV